MNTIAKKILTSLLILSAFVLSFARAQAPEPLLFITWRAESYVPPGFTGKPLPTTGTRITVSLEVIENGALQNIGGETIRWYLNDTLTRNEPGTHAVQFVNSDVPGTKQLVRVQIENYRNTGVFLAKTIEIPTVPPEAVIDAPFPRGEAGTGSVVLHGFPYFFNAADPAELLFDWDVNGARPTDIANPKTLYVSTANLPSGSPLRVALTIRDLLRVEEVASALVRLTVLQ